MFLGSIQKVKDERILSAAAIKRTGWNPFWKH